MAGAFCALFLGMVCGGGAGYAQGLATPATPATLARQAFTFTSASDLARYGVFITGPDLPGCAAWAYVVQDGLGRVRGHSGAVRPGQGALVRLNGGFAAGQATVTIVAQGCRSQRVAARRVRLGKSSPDHGSGVPLQHGAMTVAGP